METINERIKRIREEQGLKVDELALKLKVPASFLHRMEKGENNATVKIITRIHEMFPQYDLEWILYGPKSGTPVHGKSLDGPITSSSKGTVHVTKSTFINKEEIMKAMSDLKQCIARMESWINDTDDEGLYLPDE